MLEIACFNAHSAIIAANSGADRIELCADYAIGGVTPSHDTLRSLRDQTDVSVYVMIRPRGGDFTYSNDDLKQMEKSIEVLKPLANGFVFGILDDQGQVDQSSNRHLVDLAAPLPCTFHRAFDQILDMSKAVYDIIHCGFKSILTSGGPADAAAGAKTVGELQKEYGTRITFILGGGIRSTNIQALQHITGVGWYHSAAITSPGEMADAQEISKLQTILKQDKE